MTYPIFENFVSGERLYFVKNLNPEYQLIGMKSTLLNIMKITPQNFTIWKKWV